MYSIRAQRNNVRGQQWTKCNLVGGLFVPHLLIPQKLASVIVSMTLDLLRGDNRTGDVTSWTK